MNILFPVVWLKIKYSPGRATTIPPAMLSPHQGPGIQLAICISVSEKVEAGYHLEIPPG